MLRTCLLFLLTLFLLATKFTEAQQKKGKYKPTKFDSVKKIIPPQVYGRDALRADSIARAEALRKQMAEQERIANEKRIAAEKAMEEQRQTEEKKSQQTKKKKSEVISPAPTQEKKWARPVKKQGPPKEPVVKKASEQDNGQRKPVANAKPNPQVGPQKEFWTLEDCIAYAKANKLEVATALLDERYAQLLYEESKNSRYPDLNGSLQAGKAFGRNIDPASNQFVSNNFNYNSAGLFSQTLLFGWFQKKYQVEKNQLDAAAASLVCEQLRDDISLNITTGFLRVLQAREEMKMAEQALQNTQNYLNEHKRSVKSDDVSRQRLSAMLASDSAQVVEANGNARLALLQLKALMNFSFDQAFNIRGSNQEITAMPMIAVMPDAEQTYESALRHRALTQVQELKLRSAQKSLDIAKALQYPQLSLYGNLGTVYSSNVKTITGQTYEGESSVGYVNISGSSYPVTRSQYNYDMNTRRLGDQYRDHVRAGIGLQVQVPILNGYNARAAIQKAKIALVGEQISLDAEKLKLRQEIFALCEEARSATQKYFAYKKAADESARLFEVLDGKSNAEQGMIYETERAYEAFQLNQTKALRAKYELLLKLKMLDHYTGNPIKI